MVKKREKSNYLIQSVSHSIDVLEELAKAGEEVGVTELSKSLNLHKNNVFRLLATLELRGYAEQNPKTENYRLGVKCLELGQAYSNQSPLVERAKPMLQELCESIGETASLAVLQNNHIQYPISFEAKKPVKVSGRMAVSFEAKSCAVGRLLMAQLNDSTLAELLASNSPQDAAIKNQLKDLRSSGKIVDRGGIEIDVVSIAKVIKGLNNEVVGAVEVLIPQYRAKSESVIESIESCANKISTSIGSMSHTLANKIEKEVVTATTSASSTKTSPKTTTSITAQ